MKQILIVSATSQEIAPFLTEVNQFTEVNQGYFQFIWQEKQIHVLITGIGMVNTAYALGKIHQQRFDLIINAGIAGSFDSQINLGDCVLVIQDQLAEMGAEDGELFIKYEDLQLGGTNVFYAKYNDEFPALQAIKRVKGITVNKVHGHEPNIKKTIALFAPAVESMEGAAFFKGTENMSDIIIQIRSISNRIEKRNRAAWQIPMAVNQLNNLLKLLIESIV